MKNKQLKYPHDFFLEDKRNDVLENTENFLPYLKKLKQNNEYNYRRPLFGPSSPHSHIDNLGNKSMLLSSNNYLNLSNDPEVVKASNNALLKYGNGSGSVPLLSGTYDIHIELEKKYHNFILEKQLHYFLQDIQLIWALYRH